MNILKETILLLRKNKEERSTSLQMRLFLFFALLIIVLGLSFTLILMVTGVFDAGKKENRILIENELSHLLDNASEDFGRLSIQGASFSEQLSSNIDSWLLQQEIPAREISEHPELIEDLLSRQASTILSTLQNNMCSGAFLILDSTVNPQLAGAKHSKAGIFFKRTEPNTVNLVNSKIYYLRGPASIARENGIELLGQWQMEFDVTDSDYFHTVIKTAQSNRKLTLSRLYYWSKRVLLSGNSESGIFLCLPLISSDGTVYGICGMEVSSMLFKLEYSPDNSHFPRIFSALSPVNPKNALSMDEGLIAGNSYLTSPTTGPFVAHSDSDTKLTVYQAENGEEYIGLDQQIRMYPSNSPFESDSWVLTVMMPKADWNAAVTGNRILLYGSLLLLLLISLLLAVFISRRYIKPVVDALDKMKADSRTSLPKTKIAEIDDLLEFLSMQDEQREALHAELTRAQQKTTDSGTVDSKRSNAFPDFTAYQQFIRNIDTLSGAESAVFNLYMKGYTAKEIAELLCLSINTIKTHNKRIYNKLNVSSRKELMVYVQMMSSEKEGKT